MLFKDGQHYSSLGFNVTKEDVEKLNQKLENLANQSKSKVMIEIPPTSSLQDIADAMKEMEVSRGVALDNVYEVITPLWSWKLSRKQVEYLIEGLTLKIEPTIFTELQKPSKLPKQKQTIPFWANDWRK